jgi:hypothetical protein
VEIEEEEIELCQQLEEILADYNTLQSAFTGPVDDFNMDFLESLDHWLYPKQASSFGTRIWSEKDHDLLGPGDVTDWYHQNWRGKFIRKEHREGIREDYMLSLLFS